VAAAGTVSRVTSASGAGASHGAAVAAAVGVGVVRVAAWTFRMGTDGGGSSAGPARVGISGAKMSTSGGLINRDLEQMSKINGEITFFLR